MIFLTSQIALAQMLFRLLEPSESLYSTGVLNNIVKEQPRYLIFIILFFQSCLLDSECKAYQYNEHEQENCILIHEATQNSISFVSNKQNQVFVTGEY